MGSDEGKIIDIAFPETRRKRIRVDGDDSRVLELDTADLNIFTRLSRAYPKLATLAKDANLPNRLEGTDAEKLDTAARVLAEIDGKMRELVDYVFDSGVSDICRPTGTMYDSYGGEFVFEIILGKLIDLYGDNAKAEYSKISKRIQKHTDKYLAPPATGKANV